MKRLFTLLAICFLLTSRPVMACNLSQATNWSFTPVGNNWQLTFQLDIGRGVSGTTFGADDDTRTIGFAFFGSGTLISFSPASITGTFSGCTMNGVDAGPLGSPFNSQNTVLYTDPGYYGYAPCVTTPFACVTSTALCGNIGIETNNFTMVFDCFPDSMAIMGVEGGGSAIQGCYGNSDMRFDFTALPGPIVASQSSTPCGGDTITLYALSGLSSYLWSNGATSDSIRVDTGGWYWCDLNIGSACGGRDSIFVTFFPEPQPVYTPSGTQMCTGSYVSYQWYRNGVLLPGETNMCTSTIIPGVYTVIVVDGNGCSNRQGFITGNTAADFNNTFTVFPNPAREVVKLRFNGPILESSSLLLYDMTGKLIYHADFPSMPSEFELSLAGIAKGSYMLEIKTGNFSATRKVVKVE